MFVGLGTFYQAENASKVVWPFVMYITAIVIVRNASLAIYTNPITNSCMRIPDTYNCDSFSIQAAKRSELECDRCAIGYYKDSDPRVVMPDICLEASNIYKCKRYSPINVIQNATFMCLECEDGYYLLLNTCIERELIDDCEIYSPYTDICEVCREGYIPVAQNYLCRPAQTFVINIDSCAVYSEPEQCYRCHVGYYVSNEKCAEVPVENKIANCETYESLYKCEVCAMGYYNQDNTCIQAQALNCLTYHAIDRCKTCQEGYGLKYDGIRVNCEKIVIPNC